MYTFFLLTDTAPTVISSFFFNDTATTEIYTLSLHDALPISTRPSARQSLSSARSPAASGHRSCAVSNADDAIQIGRAQSELQSRSDLVCRLLLEKKKKKKIDYINTYTTENVASHMITLTLSK